MILKSLELEPFLSNCYIVGSEVARTGIVIDPGAEADVVMDAINELGLSIALIVATHCHMDHIGAVAQVKESTGAGFAIHEAERGGLMQSMSRRLSFLPGSSPRSPLQPDRWLKDGDVLRVGELAFTVLHTPGHSQGGICLYGHGVVFSGDTLFNFGIGRTDFPGCSHEQLLHSIFTKLMSLPNETRVYPGHGTATTIGTEREWNPFLREGTFLP